MDEKNVSLTALDKMVNDERSQLAKAIIPYLPPQGQRLLSLYTQGSGTCQHCRCFFCTEKHGDLCGPIPGASGDLRGHTKLLLWKKPPEA